MSTLGISNVAEAAKRLMDSGLESPYGDSNIIDFQLPVYTTIPFTNKTNSNVRLFCEFLSSQLSPFFSQGLPSAVLFCLDTVRTDWDAAIRFRLCLTSDYGRTF